MHQSTGALNASRHTLAVDTRICRCGDERLTSGRSRSGAECGMCCVGWHISPAVPHHVQHCCLCTNDTVLRRLTQHVLSEKHREGSIGYEVVLYTLQVALQSIYFAGLALQSIYVLRGYFAGSPAGSPANANSLQQQLIIGCCKLLAFPKSCIFRSYLVDLPLPSFQHTTSFFLS